MTTLEQAVIIPPMTRLIEVTYPVNTIYASFQGEGVLTGVPMVIVRLQGCDVGCPWCDTKQTWALDQEVKTFDEALGDTPAYTQKTPGDIGLFVRERWPQLTWILLTGGEPARYPLKPLVDLFHSLGYRVALETSGTETGHLDAGLDWVCVSPKLDMPGGKVVQSKAVASAHEIKYPVGKQADIDKLTQLLAEHPHRQNVIVSVQPLSQSENATKLCLETVQKNNWRLSIQTHKYISVP